MNIAKFLKHLSPDKVCHQSQEWSWAGLGWGHRLTLALSRLGLVSSHGLSVGCSAAGAGAGLWRASGTFLGNRPNYPSVVCVVIIMVPSAALLGKQTHWSPRHGTVQWRTEH